jgi:hypothetical protein
MTAEESTPEGAGREYIERFLDELTDPIHRRLVEAYTGDDPVASMEAELGEVLKEALEDAN